MGVNINSEVVQELLSELQRLKRASPKIGYSEFWREIDRIKKEESKLFDKEDEELRMSHKELHRPFTI